MASNVNILFGCEDCRYADRYGRDCKHGMLFPILLLMSKAQDCPNFERKTTEQIKEQLKF